MKATKFEYRHQTLLHQLIVGAAFLTYLIDRDDIIWRFVRNTSTPRVSERSLFVAATFLIAVGVGICTWARAFYKPKRQYLGELLYAIGLGFLMPLSGFIILVAGESLRILRLALRENDRDLQPSVSQQKSEPAWGKAIRNEAVRWGILLTMIVFSITLKDRLAEILAASSFLIGLLLNSPIFNRSAKPAPTS